MRVIYAMRGAAIRIISARKANAREVRGMSRTRVRVDPDDRRSLPPGRVDHAVLDRATEADVAAQQRRDDAEAMQDMAQYARRVRRRLGLTQVEFARRIDAPRETLRNWEQGLQEFVWKDVT